MTPPAQLFRVEYVVGYGYPDVYKREQTKRTYESAEQAGRMVATILARPDHFELVGVWSTPTAWTPVEPASLPVGGPVYDEAEV